MNVFSGQSLTLGAVAAAFAIFLVSTSARGQVESVEPTAPRVEEIVVRGSRSGDPRSVNERYAEQLQKQVFAEFRRRQREEEKEKQLFRKSVPMIYGNSRVAWGLDSKADLRWRRRTQLVELQHTGIKAKTLVRIGI